MQFRLMPTLTEADYDALFSAMENDMPRISRDVFPLILAQLAGTGALTVTVTGAEIIVRGVTTTKVYGVRRKPKLQVA